jgi:hypothetical protein
MSETGGWKTIDADGMPEDYSGLYCVWKDGRDVELAELLTEFGTQFFLTVDGDVVDADDVSHYMHVPPPQTEVKDGAA